MTQDDQTIIAAKQIAHAHLHNLASGGDVKDAYHADAHLWASHPFNKLQGHDAINGFWQQLRTALPDLERRDSIFTGGYSKPDARIDDNSMTGRLLIATMGNYQGTFTRIYAVFRLQMVSSISAAAKCITWLMTGLPIPIC